MKAAILAGGLGTRLYPVTYAVPKAMVPIANRPLLERILGWLVRSEVREVALAVCYKPETIREHFKDGADFGVRLDYVMESEPLGTGGAVKNCSALLDGPFVVMNGDILTSFDLAAMLEFHARKRAAATIATVLVPDPSRYGVVESDSEGRVKRFLEKPAAGAMRDQYINAGIYIFESGLLAEMPPPPFSMERDFFPHLLQKRLPFYAFRTEGYWIDVGTAESYRQAHRDILDGKLRVPLDGAERQPRVRVGHGTSIAEGAVTTAPALVGRDCRVRARAALGPYCVVGDQVVIEQGASMSRSVVWDGCVVGAGARIADCIIGSGIRIEPGASLVGQAIAEQTGCDCG